MKKTEFQRLQAIAIEKLESSSVTLPQNFLDKNIDELIQINEIYQAELEAQNDELQSHILDLEEAQNELAVLFNQAPIPYILLTAKFKILRANERALKMFGANSFLSQNVPFYTYLYKGHMTVFLDWIHSIKEGPSPLEMLLKTAGGLRFCRLHFHKWSQQDSDTFLLSVEDIHAQNEEHDRFKSLFQNSQQGIIYIDEKERIVDINDTAIQILGFPKQKCAKQTYSDIDLIFLDEDKQPIPEKDLPFILSLRNKSIQATRLMLVWNAEQERHVRLSLEAIPHFSLDKEELLGVFCIFTDISKEYLLNRELKQQLETFKTLGNNIPDVILRFDKNQEIIYINQEGVNFFQIDLIHSNAKKLCDFSLFQSERSKEFCRVLKDLDKLSRTITYSLNHKSQKKNKNYFIRLIPERLEGAEKSFLLIIEDITQRVESEDMFNQLFYNASDAIILTEHKTGKIKSINSKARNLLDFDVAKIDSFCSKDIFDNFKSKQQFQKHIDALESYGEDIFETTKELANGQIVYLKVYCSLIDIGEHTYHQSIVHDLTEHKLLERQLSQTSKVFEHTTEGIMITELDSTIISVNDAFSKITGYKREEVIGKNPSILKSGKHDKEFYENMWVQIEKEGVWKGEIWNRKKDGTIYPEWLAVSPIYDENNKPQQFVAVFSDFSEIKNNQLQLEQLAHYDPLTRLPNRLLLQQQLNFAVKSSKRHKNKFAILFIDLDRFKSINDTHGHGVGDEVLKHTAKRLKGLLRDSDTVARLGGDEFVIVLYDINHSNDIHHIAQTVIDKLQEPFVINGDDHFISASIGISIFPDDAEIVELLLKHADIAMYESKSTGRNNYHFFSNQMAETAQSLSNLHNDLNKALANQEFYIVYQPQYDAAKKEIVGFEALLRWRNAILGEVGPDKFIPYAEESQLIIPIGKWIFEQVVEDWQHINEILTTKFTIAINISAVQLNQNFVNYLEFTINKHPDLVKVLKIEITESSAMKNFQSTQNVLEQIKAMGFIISLDDFGTGYSALNAIKQLKVDEIKIDRSFIQDVPGDKEDEELVSTIIAMAKVMKKQLIAEGVETTHTRDFLLERRCNIIQGFLFSRPLTLEKTLKFIRENNRIYEN